MKKKTYRQVCVEFELNQEELLTSFKKAVDDRMLNIVNKNNKNFYRIVQETHLDEDCVIDSQIGETLESTNVIKDQSIRLTKLPMTVLKRSRMNSGCSKLKYINN